MTMLNQKHSWIKQFNMDEISTVSKKVKDREREVENGVHSGTINLSLFDSGIEAGESKTETEIEEPAVATFYLNNENGNETPSPILRNLNAVRKYSFTRSILKKNLSEPNVPSKTNGVYFQNKAFESDDVTASKRRQSQSFADVVTQFIAEPIKEDLHPFGRGHLYQSVLGDDQPKIHRGEESVLMWVLAILLILGIAVGVIILSQMHILRQKYLGDIGIPTNQSSISQ